MQKFGCSKKNVEYNWMATVAKNKIKKFHPKSSTVQPPPPGIEKLTSSTKIYSIAGFHRTLHVCFSHQSTIPYGFQYCLAFGTQLVNYYISNVRIPQLLSRAYQLAMVLPLLIPMLIHIQIYHEHLHS